MNEEYIKKIKLNFPIFKNNPKKNLLHYLDNAAITHVPKIVINSFSNFYSKINSNVHRSAYYLSELATDEYENAREKISNFIGSTDKSQCIFVKSTTEGINLVANAYLRPILKNQDEIIISGMEHHSNIVPWYMLAKEFNANLKIIPLLQSGDLDYNAIEALLTAKAKFLSLVHISNALGTINNIKRIIDLAHIKNIPVLIDGAQSLLNNFINVTELNCDFFTISAHKCYGPNGIGILYGKKKILNEMNPYQGGGDMIKHVTFTEILWNDYPYKFEAGTQPIANIIAFGKTIDFLTNIDLKLLFDYKYQLLNYALNRLTEIKGLTIIGTPINRAGIISFTLNNIHPHDFGTIANHYGVCVRTGHHCAMPVMDFYGISSTIRLSLGLYNVKKDIDALIKVIHESKKIFR
ncbi:MAG TPA: cysteine desulfurase [Candidatus Azoamicus sp. OHIO2]